MAFDFDMIKQHYSQLDEQISLARKILNRPMTLTEKVLYAHLSGKCSAEFKRGEDYSEFNPDRVAMQDATAQMALLQFMMAGKSKTAVPSTVHCDHLIQAKVGASDDLTQAETTNEEVYDFLSSVSNKYGIGFWKPGAGIIHQVILENYAFPGGMMIGTDSHTVNAGGLGMVAIGVGGADAVDVMTGLPWELKFPKIFGVKLTGKLNGWTAPKDVILHLAGILTAKGGTGSIVEYFGDGCSSISCTGKGTICNMGAEIGATTSIFPYDKKMEAYLRATDREDIASEASKVEEHLRADEVVFENPEKYYDQIIEIDLSTLEPHLNGPFTPDKAWPISQFAKAVNDNDFPKKLDVGLIGSCTNSSYEDLDKAASLAKQVVEKNLKPKAQFLISPGSEQVRYTIERDGQLDALQKMGGVMLANACGPCIGQWARDGAEKEEKNSIITSFNRNFAKRADGNPNTFAFVASPEIVTAMTIAGDMTFNPLTDTLTNETGEQVKLDPPIGDELPTKGFTVEDAGYQEPVKDGSVVEVIVKPDSDRLQILNRFDSWNGKNISNLKLLIKAKGKCTTDHISMAGPWLRYRGHLDNISNNLLLGAVNAFNNEVNKVKNQLTCEYDETPKVAKAYSDAEIGSIIVGDENYGEGSSREHAAMEPRNRGVKAVLVKSFARIHETNLKKQGVLALTFAFPRDYDRIQEDDTFTVFGLEKFVPGRNLYVEVVHKNGRTDIIKAKHTFSKKQIEWFKAGSALNTFKN
ncbi:MAG: aconitate hydratase [Candidatus Marinimicrobia bacterium]|nr:aconitate hydratase [Candidatus Neomarinimicrobiota bacterium]MBL7023271.1 aconitate hydratase [Candidatus Neomarinimicrobiota bacterium]MBL7108865.1 aconitate hydratase [Candidatus Neomarinimicrobiota bacterium]